MTRRFLNLFRRKKRWHPVSYKVVGWHIYSATFPSALR